MLQPPTAIELDSRMKRFLARMDAECPDWDSAAIFSNVNQYYFLSTIQDGILLIRRRGGYSYYARSSYERARQESPLPHIYPMRSYRDILSREPKELGTLYIEEDWLSYGAVERIRKYFSVSAIKGLDAVARGIRSVKSEYEARLMEASGKAHSLFLSEKVPALMREGMSEAEFFSEAFSAMVSLGYQGISRFSKPSTEIQFGQFGFGENSLYPTSFDGPDGMRAYSSAVPLGGDPYRVLKKGDIVFVDIAFGINGYHTDKTQVYSFGKKPPTEAASIQSMCLGVLDRAHGMMREGELAQDIYRCALSSLSEEELRGFMGFETRTVKFIGHGIGLNVDEAPVLAEGFAISLESGMHIAVEPKKGLAGIGMLGCEETFRIGKSGAECITGGARPIMTV